MCDNEKKFKNFQNLTKDDTNIPVWIERTLHRFEDFKGIAYDLGCGAGNLSCFLVQKGWNVIAVDKEVEIIKSKKEKLKDELKEKLEIVQESFENLEMKKCDFILAINSLPWCDKDKFNDMWNKINKSLKVGGRIAITFFGPNDDLAKTNSNMTILNKDEILNLLKDFQIEGKTAKIIEKEYDRNMVNGTNQHSHIFIVMAKKINNKNIEIN